MYAVLETGGKQYRVTAGDTLEIERLAVEAGQPFTFDRVLLVNNEGRVTIGAPMVADASVVADVVEHRRGPKKITFKMKRRKGYHKTIGHRQELTIVKIKEIKTAAAAVAETQAAAVPSPVSIQESSTTVSPPPEARLAAETPTAVSAAIEAA